MSQGELGNLALYFHTLRRLRPGQAAARLSLYVRRQTLHRWPWYLARRYQVADSRIALAPSPLLPYDRDLVSRTAGDELFRNELRTRLADLEANRFHFLNRTVAFGDAICWDPPAEDRLWRYNLNYFDFTWDLILAEALLEGEAGYLCFRRLAADWIARCPVARGVGWHSYPVAIRLVNWIYAAVAFRHHLEKDEPFRRQFLASLYGQCRFLADHLEWDCRGNHLLEDGKSLLTAGLFFTGPEAESWFRQGTGLVWQALEDQVLPDGGHYERSPMYHAIVLQDYLEIFALFRARGLALPPGAADRVKAMVDFCIGLRHPDGEMPLFGDAAFGIARGLPDLLPPAAVLLDESRYKWPDHTFGPWPLFF